MADFDVRIELVDEVPAGSPGESLKNSALLGDLGPELQTQILRDEISRLSRLQQNQVANDMRSQALADRQAQIRETLELKIAARREQSEIKIAELAESLSLRSADKVARIQETASIRNIQREDRSSDEMAKRIGRSVVTLNPGGLLKNIFTGFSESIGRAAFSQFRQVTKDQAVDPGKYIGNVAGGLYNRASAPVARVLGYNSTKEMVADNSDPLAMVDRLSVAFSRGNRESLKMAAETGKRGNEFLNLYFQNLSQTVSKELNEAAVEIIGSSRKRVVNASLYLTKPYLEYRRALGIAEAVKESKTIPKEDIKFSERDLKAIERTPQGGTLVVGNPGFTTRGKVAAENFGMNLRQTTGLDYVPLNRPKQTDFLSADKLPENFKKSLQDPEIFTITKKGIELIAKASGKASQLPEDFSEKIAEASTPDELVPLILKALKVSAEETKSQLLPFVEQVITGTQLDLAEQIAQINKIREIRPDINLKYLGFSGATGHVRDIEQATGVKGIAMGSIINEDRGHPTIVGGQDHITKEVGDIHGYLKTTKLFKDAGQEHRTDKYFDNQEVVKFLVKELESTLPPKDFAEGIIKQNEEIIGLNAALDPVRNRTEFNKSTSSRQIRSAKRIYDKEDPLEGDTAKPAKAIRSIIESAPNIDNDAFKHLSKILDKEFSVIAKIPENLNLEQKKIILEKGFNKIFDAIDDYIHDAHLFVKKEEIAPSATGLAQVVERAGTIGNAVIGAKDNLIEGTNKLVQAERKAANALLNLEDKMSFGQASKFKKWLGKQANETAHDLGALAGATVRQKIIPAISNTGENLIRNAIPMAGDAINYAAPRISAGAGKLARVAGSVAQNIVEYAKEKTQDPLSLPLSPTLKLKAELIPIQEAEYVRALPPSVQKLHRETRQLTSGQDRLSLPGSADQLSLPPSQNTEHTEEIQKLYDYIDSRNKEQLAKIASRLGIKYAKKQSKELLQQNVKLQPLENLGLVVEAEKRGSKLPDEVLSDFSKWTSAIKTNPTHGDPAHLRDTLAKLKYRFELTKSQSAAINLLMQQLDHLADALPDDSELAGFDVADSPLFKAILERSKEIVTKHSGVDVSDIPIEIDPKLKSSGLMSRATGSPVVKIQSDMVSAETIIHELRHAAQFMNPSLKLMTPKDVSPEEYERVKGGIAKSVTSYMNRNPNANYAQLDKVHALETDAYLFAQKFYKGLQEQTKTQTGTGRQSNVGIGALAAYEAPDPWSDTQKNNQADIDKLVDALNKLVRVTPPSVQRIAEPSVNRFDASLQENEWDPFNQKLRGLQQGYSNRAPKEETTPNPVRGGGSPEGLELHNFINNLRVGITAPLRFLATDVTKELDKLKSLYKAPNASPELKQRAETLVNRLKPESISKKDVASIQNLNQEFEKYYKLRDLAERKLSGQLSPTEKMIDALQPKVMVLAEHFEALTGVKFTGNIGQFLRDLVGVGLDKLATFGLPILMAKTALSAQDAALQLDKFSLQLQGLGEGQSAIEKLNESILKTGVNINASREAYLGFKSGLIGTNNESQFDQIFENLQVTLKNRVPSADRQNLVVQGLVQMLSKGGAVQSEEFRGQVSESLRGSLQLAQAATGFDATTFTRKLKRQEIQAETFVPAFLAAGRGGTPTEGNSATEKMERYASATQMFSERVGKVPLEFMASGADLAAKAIGFLNQNSELLALLTGTVIVRSMLNLSNVLLVLIERYAGTTLAQLTFTGALNLTKTALIDVTKFTFNFLKSMIVPAAIVGSIMTVVEAYKALGQTQGQIGELVDRMVALNKETIKQNELKTRRPDPKRDVKGSELDNIKPESWFNQLDNLYARSQNWARRFSGKALMEENQGTKRELDNTKKKLDEGFTAAQSNYELTTTGILATTPQDVSKFQDFNTKEQVLKTKISVASASGDVENVVKLNEELKKLQDNKEPVVKKIFDDRSRLTEQAESVRAVIKDLEQQIKDEPAKAPIYEKQLLQYKGLLAELDNSLKQVGLKLNPEIVALSKFRSNIESLDAEYNRKTQQIAIQKAQDTQVADATGGSVAVSKTGIANAKVDISTLQQEIKQLQDYRKQVIKQVLQLDPNTKAVLETALGKSLTQANTADIDRVLADVDKFNINKPQEAILQSLKKIGENSVTMSQKQLELENSQQAYVKAQIDFANQLSDYYRNQERALLDESIQMKRFARGFGQQATDAVLTTQSTEIQNAAQSWKNRFQKAVMGSTDNLVTSLATTLSGVIDDTKTRLEGQVTGRKLYTDLSRTILGAQESVQDQNLSNSRAAEDRAIQSRDMFGQKASGYNQGRYNPSLVTKGVSERDLANLALTTLQESSGRQNQLDVAVSIFNRLAKGYSKSLTGVTFAPGQYQPNFGKTPVNTIDEAAARLGGGSAKSEIMRLISDLRNPEKVRRSQAFIQGATDFKGTSELRNRWAGDPYRGTMGANFFHAVNSPTVQNQAIQLISRMTSGIATRSMPTSATQSKPTQSSPGAGNKGQVGPSAVGVPLKIETFTPLQTKLDPRYVQAVEAQTKAQFKANQLQSQSAQINSNSSQVAYARSAQEEIFRRRQEITSRQRDIRDRLDQNKGFVDSDLKNFQQTQFSKSDQLERLQFDKTNLDKFDIPAMQKLLKDAEALNKARPGTVQPETIKSAKESLTTMITQSKELSKSIEDLNKIDGDVPLLLALESRIVSINSELIGTKAALLDIDKATAQTSGQRSFIDTAVQIQGVRDKFGQNRSELPVQIQQKELEKGIKERALTDTTLTPEAKAKYQEELMIINEVIEAKKQLLEKSSLDNQGLAEQSISSEFARQNSIQAFDFTQNIRSSKQDELAKKDYGFRGNDIRNVAVEAQTREDTERQLDNLNQMEIVLRSAGVDTIKLREEIIALGDLKLDNLITSAEEYSAKLADSISGAIVDTTTQLAEAIVDPSKNIFDIFKGLVSSILGIFKSLFADIAKEMLQMTLKNSFKGLFGGLFGALGSASGGGGGGLLGSLVGGLFGGGGSSGMFGSLGGLAAGASSFSAVPILGFANGGRVNNYAQGNMQNPIERALVSEGAGAKIAVVHSNEILLSNRNGDATRFNELVRSGLWRDFGGTNVPNYASGNIPSMNNYGMSGGKTYQQSVINNNITVISPNADSFRSSKNQIMAEQDRQARIASQKSQPY